MSLQSQLFRGDARLEAAAVSDPDHVTPGASGPHVGKIQRALNEVDDAALAVDSVYGSKTANAVLVFKQKRDIVARNRQTQADNIVGKMTIAALDSEMLEKERIPRDPIRIRSLSPAPKGAAAPGSLAVRSSLLLGFKIDVDIPNGPPDAPFLRIRLEPRKEGTLEVTSGKNGAIVCRNDGLQRGFNTRKISQIFDPQDPGLKRLDQTQTDNLADGGTIRLTKDPQIIKIDAFFPGNAFIDATNGASVNSIALEVRAPKMTEVPGIQTGVLTKTRPGSKFISESGSNSTIPGGNTGGRPVNPRGGGTKNQSGRRRRDARFRELHIRFVFFALQQ